MCVVVGCVRGHKGVDSWKKKLICSSSFLIDGFDEVQCGVARVDSTCVGCGGAPLASPTPAPGCVCFVFLVVFLP